MQSSKVISALLVLMNASHFAQADVIGDTSKYTSPNGVVEQCVAIQKLPGASYSNKDIEKEKELCGLNFYTNTVALCPKTWSTSPGTIMYDNSATGKTYQQAEATCNGKNTPLSKFGKFKQTMNGPGTSGTFSGSSLLYYHFSRALNTLLTVPVAVYRTMDKTTHYQRVTLKANPSPSAKMNLAAWNLLKAAEPNPALYTPTSDLFTADQKQIYGVLLRDKGERYGVEINGTRASGWGRGQNYDFQKTPAFLALQSSLPIKDAVNIGYANAIKDPLMKQAFVAGQPSVVQMVSWMREVSEIAILDFIFSQQDRIGNIDYLWFWVYTDATGKVQTKKDDSKLPRTKMNQIPVPTELAAFKPVLIQKTSIGDNDAGGLPNYANFTKWTGMLSGVPVDAALTPAQISAKTHDPIRHLHKDTYARLIKMANDFKIKGPLYQSLVANFGISQKRIDAAVANTITAANLFQTNCISGATKIDLVSLEDAAKGQLTAPAVDCKNP